MTTALANLPKHMKALEGSWSSVSAALSEHALSENSFLLALRGDIAENPKLAQCLEHDPASVIRCIMYAAQLGLRPGNVHQHFHLIPRGNTCTHMVGFRGLLDLARRSGEMASMLPPEIVWKGETFSYDRATGAVSHPLKLEDGVDRTNSDNILAAYVVYRLKGWSTSQVYLLGRHEIDQRRKQSSNTSAGGPWAKHYASMAKKTVLRALLNSGLIPLGDMTAHLRDSEKNSDDAEIIEPAEFTETTQQKFDRLEADPLPETEGQKEAREEREAIQAECQPAS